MKEIQSLRSDEQGSLVSRYMEGAKGQSLTKARGVAREVLGKDIIWDWGTVKTSEGFYRTVGGIEVGYRSTPPPLPIKIILTIWILSRLSSVRLRMRPTRTSSGSRRRSPI